MFCEERERLDFYFQKINSGYSGLSTRIWRGFSVGFLVAVAALLPPVHLQVHNN